MSDYFAIPWTVAFQASLSIGFPRQEYWSGLPFPPPRDLPNQRSNLSLLHWQVDSLPLSHLGSPSLIIREISIKTTMSSSHQSEWQPPKKSTSRASLVKNLPANTGDTRNAGSIPGLGRSPGGGNGNPLQYSCLGNPTDRGAWRAAVHGVSKSWKQLSDWAHTCWTDSQGLGIPSSFSHSFPLAFIYSYIGTKWVKYLFSPLKCMLLKHKEF